MAGASRKAESDVSVVLCGQAGQGLRTAEGLLADIMKRSGYYVFTTKEYMSRIRGGCNSTQVRVSAADVSAPVDRIDVLLPLDKCAFTHLGGRVKRGTLVIGDVEKVGGVDGMADVAFSRIASSLGASHQNVVAVGTVCGVLGVPAGMLSSAVSARFAGSGEKQANVKAARAGYDEGGKLRKTGRAPDGPGKGNASPGMIMLNGTEALVMGAIAGGCSFISAYPMSPSTGVLTLLSKYAGEFGIVAEQAEDEISAVNMALGAWYAGARAIITTSGGGFDLMQEGLSLAGMLEMPLVIHLAQRPGPATGLPTRTEQGDLELAMYSGHGEFPRVLLAPGTAGEAFSLAAMAFDIADRFQVPVFLITDESLLDSYFTAPPFEISAVSAKNHFVRTGNGYMRYAVTKDGISPRGIPGFGAGLVCVDSDEHDEEGHITEDSATRNVMVEKRLRKLRSVAKAAIKPQLIGPKSYRTLVVCWGSTFGAVREAIGSLGRKDVAMLHFSQVYPLHASTLGLLRKARNVICVENNATSQFARLIRAQTGFTIERNVLKYDGRPFSVEELSSAIAGEIRGR